MADLSFGSVCSGIEAASVAFGPLGWRAAWLSEIDRFACALLAHRYPETPNVGDMRTIPRRVLASEIDAPDVLCGGTPCQAFSVAGLRESLSDERGNLSLKFCEIANAIDHVRGRARLPPCVILWENVSTRDNAFGCFLAGLAGEDGQLVPPGKKWGNAGVVYGPRRAVAWRTLDAQYFGLAQRRQRVFVVASARNGTDPAKVLFEWNGVRRDSAPSRETGAAIAGTIAASAGKRRGVSEPDSGSLVAYGGNRTGGPIDVAAALLAQPGSGWKGDFESETFLVGPAHGDRASGSGPCVHIGMGVRRLTPRECERLQGFPDDYTLIPWRTWQGASRKQSSYEGLLNERGMTLRGPSVEECPDGPRYKALGNSWPVPVVRWIGHRIEALL